MCRDGFSMAHNPDSRMPDMQGQMKTNQRRGLCLESKAKSEFLCVREICITKNNPNPTFLPCSAHLEIKTTYLLLITVFIIPFRSKTKIHSQDTNWRRSGISPWKYHLGEQSLLKFAHYYIQSIAVGEKTGARRQLVLVGVFYTHCHNRWMGDRISPEQLVSSLTV